MVELAGEGINLESRIKALTTAQESRHNANDISQIAWTTNAHYKTSSRPLTSFPATVMNSKLTP